MTTNSPIKRITERGFGFIATSEAIEYFFHQSACASTPFDKLRQRQTVSFTLGKGRNGPQQMTSTCGDPGDCYSKGSTDQDKPAESTLELWPARTTGSQ